MNSFTVFSVDVVAMLRSILIKQMQRKQSYNSELTNGISHSLLISDTIYNNRVEHRRYDLVTELEHDSELAELTEDKVPGIFSPIKSGIKNEVTVVWRKS